VDEVVMEFSFQDTDDFSLGSSSSWTAASSSLIIDGIHNIPIELSGLQGFTRLSLQSRKLLAIAYHKSTDLEETSPLGLLWKGVGVHPIPDHRWIKYQGLFGMFPTNPGGGQTGIDEIDEIINEWFPVIHEAYSFSRSHNLNRQYGISETELRWSCIFLNAFGVPAVHGGMILIAPLVFARRTTLPEKGVYVVIEDERIRIHASGRIDRNDEILIFSGEFFSDVHALLFHGSWISDDSIHRGKLQLNPTTTSYWFSNIEEESVRNRGMLLEHFSTTASPFTGLEEILRLLKKKLHDITQRVVTVPQPIERIRFVYIAGLLNEIAFFEAELNIKKSETLDL